jgi:hypothetical protein
MLYQWITAGEVRPVTASIDKDRVSRAFNSKSVERSIWVIQILEVYKAR